MNDGIQVTIETIEQFCVLRLAGQLTSSELMLPTSARPWDNNTIVGGPSNAGCHAVVLDFSKLTYCDSAGIAFLIRYVREARQHQVPSVAFGISPHYRKIFQIVGMTQYVELFADEYGTLEALRARRDLAE